MTWKPGDPSPNCSMYITRKQAEELLALVRAQPQKKWRTHEAKLLKALREHAGTRVYAEAAREEGGA